MESIASSTYLAHHGIKGQKWGVRRFRNRDGSLTEEGKRRYSDSTSEYGLSNLRKARTANLDSWGKDPDHNVCYIAGYSGSGKSTTALSMAKKGDTVIHLDAYSEPGNSESDAIRSKDFDRFLDEQVPNWRRVPDATSTGENGTMRRFSKEYWDTVDSFREAIENYGKEQFAKGHKVIVEGVQIADDWLAGEKSYYSGKPTVILQTNPLISMQRAFERDGRGNIITGLKNVDSAKQYVQWYANAHKRLEDLADSTQAKRGQKAVEELIEYQKQHEFT